jgi:hypothetical protein
MKTKQKSSKLQANSCRNLGPKPRSAKRAFKGQVIAKTSRYSFEEAARDIFHGYDPTYSF